MNYSNFFKVCALCVFMAACQTPEERATGEKGGSKDDSMKNSPPMNDPYAKPTTPDTTQTMGMDTLHSDSTKQNH